MMAGILQTPILRPSSLGNGVFRRPDLYFPASPIRFSGHSLLKTSISISPIPRASGSRSDQVDGYGNQDSRDWNRAKVVNWTQPLLDFTITNFLPLALVTAIILGLANPSLGCLAHSYGLSKFSTFGIFLISGLTLRGGEIGAAVEAWPAGMFGLGSILFFSPFLSTLILKLQLVPQEFVTGLAVFCCMPTTLSSGVALTQLVGGNSALALAMTVVSNLLGILIVPFSLSKFIAGGVGVSIPTKQLFGSLVTTLLVPLIVGKVFRNSVRSVAKYLDQNRQLFSMISAIFLSLVPWIQVSRSRPLLLMVKPAVFLVAIAMGTFAACFSYGWSKCTWAPASHFISIEHHCSMELVSCFWQSESSFCQEGKCTCPHNRC
ncbi:probable sodium/metabolite cotransporter BASS4, chloroplastic isoform X2 [Magnolia sinica]|uniref:probable sodium/metabolite cotransporter BASS4, chloroplastic isoform X2 n=1 Tax=Magnolia sinica TaxID=86752 RepID=UPI00265A4133|nr:probable sodium/metabolite cotransporter BASS4, chloroplastic isoform X2 [Magnolia sinica]